MARQLSEIQKIEQSIVKKYRKQLWAPFLTAVNEYRLIEPGDRIAVCISGGKDSMCMAKMMQMLKVHSDISFDLVFLVMDPGYKPEIRRKIVDNGKRMGIPLTFFETNIFRVANSQSSSPCYLCARMRRGHLYNKAKELTCNKIALGHHLNDVIETTVMSMFWSSKLETIVPKCVSENFEGMELIRPMYRVKEDAVIAWAAYNQLSFIRCACLFTDQNTSSEDGVGASKRLEIKQLIREQKKNNPDVEDNIFRALHSVHLKTFPGVVLKDGRHSFLEYYPDGLGDDNKQD